MLSFGALRSRRWACLALCVFMLSAWMPTLSVWVAHSLGRVDMAAVCQAQVDNRVQQASLATPDKGDPATPMAEKGHCPFCLSQQHTPVLPASLTALVKLPEGLSQQLPSVFLHAQRTQHAWSPLSARAPPLVA
jgi:Protein of unknown function (DUF2946)